MNRSCRSLICASAILVGLLGCATPPQDPEDRAQWEEENDPLEPLTELRSILVARRDLETSRLAAYNIARIYERTKQYKKGLFYARTARDLSELLDRPEWIASSHNRIGNLLLAESYFAEACEEYDLALSLFEPSESVRHAILLENVGYDPTEVSGFALGMGMDRLAMLKYGIPNIKLLYENDVRFLSAF